MIKKEIFQITGLLLAIAIVISFFIFYYPGNVESYDVKIYEIKENLTHECTYYILYELIVLDCEFQTKYGLLSGKILKNSENNIYLFRENPNQAIIFGEDLENNTNLEKGIYGFKFPSDISAFEKIETNNSIIELGKRRYSRFDFRIPEDTKYMESEEMQINLG